MIEVKHLTKRYGDHAAVSDLSITIGTGQIYGFLGPNGAGKTTTMNIMTGCLAATSGQVLIDGHDIYADAAQARKLIGYLPEQPPLYTDMTPLEYLRFVGEAKGLRRTELADQVAIVMDRTQITGMKNRLIKNLSKGYRQRVGIAQAILGDPDVIILDEPMVGLDPTQIIEIRNLIKELGRDHTVILSSHILSEISAICDHIMIISQGKLVVSGTPQELSDMMTASNLLQLTVKGSAARVRELLAPVEGIERLQLAVNGSTVYDSAEESTPTDAAEEETAPEDAAEETAPDALCTVSITPQAETDLREAVFFAFADARVPILEMHQRTATLEQVFLEVTAQAAEEAQEPQQETYLYGSTFVRDENELTGEENWTEEMLQPMESIQVPDLPENAAEGGQADAGDL